MSQANKVQFVIDALDRAAIVAVTDARGVITHVNEKFCRISKFSAEELLGKTHQLVNSGLHSKEFFAQMWRTIAKGEVWEGEIRNRAKDGSLYWVNTSIVPFVDATGKPERYVSIRFEITQRKEAEEQLKVYAAKLEQTNRELQDFASIAAHDLQEPLRKISAFSERLTSQVGHQLPPQAREYLDRMLKSVSRMQRLIEDLLTYSRVGTQGQQLRTVSLDTVINDVLSDLELLVEQAGAKILRDPLPTLVADEGQMRQLFQNLISNAIKFRKAGHPPEIEIRACPSEHEFVIEVRDRGIGFDQKYTDRIFTIFQRLHGRHEYEGTGVGLAICRRIVERHGGRLTARSSPGQGSTFVVTLPRL